LFVSEGQITQPPTVTGGQVVTASDVLLPFEKKMVIFDGLFL
jgi:hypothetical protein